MIILIKKIWAFIKFLFGFTKKVESGYQIYRLIRITPGGYHAWVETSIGRMKKEIKNISNWDQLKEEYNNLNI